MWNSEASSKRKSSDMAENVFSLKESQPTEHLSVRETIFISKVDFEFLAGIN